MRKSIVLLSTGSIPWMAIKEVVSLAKEIGFDGIEFVPSRQITKDIKPILNQMRLGKQKTYLPYFKYIKGIHHSWRLDISHDQEYRLPLLLIPFFTIIRLFFFPKVKESRIYISVLSKTLNIPITVHKISPEWVLDEYGKEFEGGILYEIIGNYSKSKEAVKIWLKDNKHNIVVDTRDDQSLVWAINHGFANWKEFWTWIRLKKIKSIQLTLIGVNGIKQIMNHKHSLAEEQLLWLYEKEWKGSVVVEVNPLLLFFLNRGNLKSGLKIIYSFVQQTLIYGKKWSI